MLLKNFKVTSISKKWCLDSESHIQHIFDFSTFLISREIDIYNAKSRDERTTVEIYF